MAACPALTVTPSSNVQPDTQAIAQAIATLGVGGQNAANGQHARARGLDRSDFLDSVEKAWSQLDRETFPVMHDLAPQVRAHNDRVDFLAGIDIILRDIAR